MAAQFVDFAELKSSVRIEQIVTMLGLQMRTKGPQMRGACPACQSGGERALAINTDKQSYFCFSDKKGGDEISLVAHIKGLSQRDAATLIASHFRFTGTGVTGSHSGTGEQGSRTAPQAPQVRKASFDADAYLKALEPASPVLEALGISPETLKDWRAGYCKSGVNRGKLAIALCDRDGNILGFAGRSLDGNAPLFTYPNNVNPADIIFGADHVAGEEVRLMREPLEVMQAAEVGEVAVCFMTDTIEPQQLEMLSSLLDSKKSKIFF